ncbi:MAG TPA: phage shock protein PspA [Desulfofustis sp.]|jgi:phage shock protein A|nr:phage shock protein PspA [Desulfofustis sp. PB-SRB1]HBH29590.1 phage shock protein PspA [Desulfofustis sp.]HBH32152.1 phage shock protein PspA [Desulfofustis sp.]
MGIFTRFRDIVSANINAMLDRAEDPEKMIKMMIREMEDTLIELKSACAGVIAGRKKLQRRLDEISERQTLWAQRAQLAVEKGRDDLAREALQEKRRFTEISERLEHEISEHSGLINQYHEDVRALEAKLTSAKEKKRMLIERHRKARNKKRAQEDIRRMDSSETMARFEHLENRIERMEAEADMVNFGTTAGVAEQFDTLATDEEIEKELARMKGETYDTRNTSQSDNQA